jgi:hypothetical protein
MGGPPGIGRSAGWEARFGEPVLLRLCRKPYLLLFPMWEVIDDGIGLLGLGPIVKKPPHLSTNFCFGDVVGNAPSLAPADIGVVVSPGDVGSRSPFGGCRSPARDLAMTEAWAYYRRPYP